MNVLTSLDCLFIFFLILDVVNAFADAYLSPSAYLSYNVFSCTVIYRVIVTYLLWSRPVQIKASKDFEPDGACVLPLCRILLLHRVYEDETTVGNFSSIR